MPIVILSSKVATSSLYLFNNDTDWDILYFT
jgi:hypothetical protein